MTASGVLADVAGGWRAEPAVVVAVVVAALVYGRGIRSLWSRRVGRAVAPWRVACFAAALGALAVALLSPVDHLAGTRLSAHMVQHVLLVAVAAPLFAVSAAHVALPAALPRAARRRVHRVSRARPIRWVAGVLSRPAVVWVLAAVVLWTWHVPAAYEGALRSPLLHSVEHASFLGSALAFWWIGFASGPRRLARGADVLFVVAGGFQGAVLGALLVFASMPLYPAYAAAHASTAAALADQQLAGAIMWIPAAVVYLAAASALFVAWLSAAERAPSASPRTPAPGASERRGVVAS